MTRDEWISVAAALVIGIGVIEWSFISIEKLRIDWDWFQSVGLILICAAAGLLGYWQPRHAWRWGFLSIAAIPVDFDPLGASVRWDRFLCWDSSRS